MAGLGVRNYWVSPMTGRNPSLEPSWLCPRVSVGRQLEAAAELRYSDMEQGLSQVVSQLLGQTPAPGLVRLCRDTIWKFQDNLLAAQTCLGMATNCLQTEAFSPLWIRLRVKVEEVAKIAADNCSCRLKNDFAYRSSVVTNTSSETSGKTINHVDME